METNTITYADLLDKLMREIITLRLENEKLKEKIKATVVTGSQKEIDPTKTLDLSLVEWYNLNVR